MSEMPEAENPSLGVQPIPASGALRYSRVKPGPLAEQEDRSVMEKTDLERQREEGQHRRGEQARELIATGILLLMGSIFGVAILAILAFAWHSLISVKYHWLTEDQLSVLRTVLFSGIIASATSSYFQKYS